MNRLSARVRRTVLSVLSCHVHEQYQKQNPSVKDLVSWMSHKNSARSFLFYKANGLRALMDARNLTLTQGPKTAARMIEALAGVPGTATTRTDHQNRQDAESITATPAKEAAIRAILEKSFLPHQKGKAREYCSLGHKLEIPILKNWVHLTGGEEASFSEISVEGAFTAGLAAKKDAAYAKDSVDFVLAVKDVSAGEDDNLVAWGFEAKGRVTFASAAKEQHHMRALRNTSNPFSSAHTRVDSSEVYEQVANLAERFQVLQHAFVYDFPTVVLAISDNQSRLIRSTVIDFSSQLKDHFGSVLQDIKNLALSWAYPALTTRPQIVQIPEEIFSIADTIPNINGNEALQGAANLWLAMSKLPKPFPSFRRLIPGIYAYWNSVKGGSDTTTKLMDDCILCVPKSHLNTETASQTRLIMLLFVLYHRLNQAFTSDDNYSYPSLRHYRAAASARCTFHTSLLTCATIFKEAIPLPDDENEPPVSSPRPNHLGNERRRNPSRRRIDGALPKATTFGASLSMKTPKKMNQMIGSGTAAPEIEDMIRNCTGIPMKSHPKVPHKCCVCKSKTTWYCVGCKRWFCMERRDTKENKKKLELYSHHVKGASTTFQKACFHRIHEERWRTETHPAVTP